MIYKFNWAQPKIDPRTTISNHATVLEGSRVDGLVQTWQVKVEESEASQAVIDALNGTGFVLGTVATEVTP